MFAKLLLIGLLATICGIVDCGNVYGIAFIPDNLPSILFCMPY